MQEMPSNADDTAEDTVRYLEELSIKILEAHIPIDDPSNAALVQRHSAHNLQLLNTSIHECPIPAANSLEQHISNTKSFVKDHPEFQIVAQNATGVLEQDGKHAVVWVTERGCDAADERMFNRESVSLMYWRHDEKSGLWKWYRHYSIRGGGDLFSNA